MTLTYKEAVEVGCEAARIRDRASEDTTIKALSALEPNEAWTAVEFIDATTDDDWTWRLLMRRARSTAGD